MKRPKPVLVLIGLAFAGCALVGQAPIRVALASESAVSTGPGQGIVINNPTPDDICTGSTLKTNCDGSYENGYAWAYMGVMAPYYGAWAEGFTCDVGNFAICGMRFSLTQVGAQDGWLLDAYVWDESGSSPNNVLSMTTGFNPGIIASWPQISQHDVDISDIPVSGSYFVGWWGNWVGTANGWYVAADENGFGGGLPRTNIVPGIGYPTGWQHPNVVSTFSNCMDLGIGVYEGGGIVPPDDPPPASAPVEIPARMSSWGSVKALFN